MRNKKRLIRTLFVVIVLTTVVLRYYLVPVSSTFGVVTVLEKHPSGEEGEAYIIAASPNADDTKEYLEEEKRKIIVKETKVWNLIEKGKTYVVSYDNKRNGVSILKEIEDADK